ncbi:MAG TPA: T9SS type A sorting domain-containing protein [Fulvivirga sp.]|nr:T9SS type A sorting domain-containing protein [Fulvivirga sp.]
MKKFYIILILVFGGLLYLVTTRFLDVNKTSKSIHSRENIKEKDKSEKLKTDKPGEFYKYYNEISIRVNHTKSGYKPNYRYTELVKAQHWAKKNLKSRTESFDIVSRGPGNVAGRTRAIVVDPDDATHNTWFVGAASGGIWKTTDGGSTWLNISPDLPNLSTNSIAMAASNTNVIYVGTGELFAGNYTFVRGDGVFKSIDKGVTWQQLASTADDSDFSSVNRIIIDPSDENIVVVCTNFGIFKSIDGGVSWTNNFDGYVQDLVADPSNFNTQYAGVNSNGIYKSIDAGNSWVKSSEGIGEGVRFELAVSAKNPNKVYTSTYDAATGESTIVYQSVDKGQNWAKAFLPNNVNGNFLGEQGWYDNAIAVNPYDEDEVFVGGVYIGKYNFSSDINTGVPAFAGVDLEGTESFMSFVNFGQDFFGGALAIGDGNNASTEFHTVEVRFGPGMSQKAHRFTVPANGGTNSDGGAGVPDTDYAYEDYVDVPFEVWDMDDNEQLMISFRDQERDGTFNLNPSEDADNLTSREYLFIHNITYNGASADAEVSAGGGSHLKDNMYFFWPQLVVGATFPPTESAIMRINYKPIVTVGATAEIVSDPRGGFGGKNGNLHADHHNITMIPINEGTGEFRILNGNDGGLGISINGGTTFTQITDGYITTQFYGADKKPGADEYIGGMQDNGTWRSPSGVSATNTTAFDEVLGGDGFEVIWHAKDPDKLMGSLYNNRINRSTTGGGAGTWTTAQSGINTAEGPFITRLASSRTSPDVVYAVSSTGVLKTTDFGGSWVLTPISVEDGWTFLNAGTPYPSSQLDVEVSLANDQVVWAGGGMSDGARKIFVSTDGGESFNATIDYPTADLGAISGLATHPTDENTAYVLFSFAGSPKILRTTDLGKTWEDISGFSTNESTSSNGFPDVFVHSLLVLPYDTDIIWAGTEIGLFESTDNGVSWHYADIGLPAVSIWSMKVVDDQVVFGTHGRGIMTAALPELLNPQLVINGGEYLGNRKVSIDINLPVDYDEVKVFVNGNLKSTKATPTKLLDEIQVDIDAVEEESITIYIEGAIGGSSFKSPSKKVNVDFRPSLVSLSQDSNEIESINLVADITEEYDSIQFYINDKYSGSINEITIGNITTSFGISSSGNFTAIAVGYYGEQAFSSLSISTFVTTITGLHTFENEKGFSIYPNPTSAEIGYVLPESVGDIYTLTVVNGAGEIVITKTLNKYVNESILQLEQLNQGIYILQLKDDKNVFTKRFIKK